MKKPRTIDDLKTSIRQEIEAVLNEMLKKIGSNFGDIIYRKYWKYVDLKIVIKC